ncbi:hypothetical protein F8388_001128 [Cannabis sativa]|uniref:Uncharacterized protein n=1 Tax=Cannabis sativa TaxID=3483 RepID=A0A7J6DQF6_CANSA|nr:hypothetical protein F8388_001128 [Cannabis sativa]
MNGHRLPGKGRRMGPIMGYNALQTYDHYASTGRDEINSELCRIQVDYVSPLPRRKTIKQFPIMVLADQDECSPIPTSPESSVAQPRQRWVFCPSRGGATEVLRIQEKVTERRAVYHYDRCQVEVQFQVKASVFSSCCLLWSSSFLPSLFNEINSKSK